MTPLWMCRECRISVRAVTCPSGCNTCGSTDLDKKHIIEKRIEEYDAGTRSARLAGFHEGRDAAATLAEDGITVVNHQSGKTTYERGCHADPDDSFSPTVEGNLFLAAAIRALDPEDAEKEKRG